jgi:hypothetical protein
LGTSIWIGKTPHEDWGLWAMVDVFTNQRHLAFGYAMLMLTLLFVYPLFLKPALTESSAGGPFIQRCLAGFKNNFASREAWLPLNWGMAIAMGLLLGLSGFWNGAAVIGTLLILFVMTFPSAHKLEFLIIAVLAMALSAFQTVYFIGPGPTGLRPELVIGFLAPHRDLLGILSYYTELLGIFPLVVLAGLVTLPKRQLWLVAAFLTPLIFANYIKMIPEIAMNHKYVALSVFLLNIVVARFLLSLFQGGKMLKAGLAVVLTVMLTVTGLFDFLTFVTLNQRYHVLREHEPLMVWVKYHTRPEDIFLADWYSIHPVLMAGRKLYYGWPYYAWGAGYNTLGRENMVKEVFAATKPDEIPGILLSKGIRYVIIDDSLRQSQNFSLNEQYFKDNFEMVYETAFLNTTVYKVPEGD